MAAEFLAVDWGTTNRRAFLIQSDGEARLVLHDGLGVTRMAGDGFASQIEALRAAHGDLFVLCAGMVGSDRGWMTAPYVGAPASLEDLAKGVVWAERGRTAIVPGVRRQGERYDVMRGEEVQFLGAAAAKIAPPDAVLCQPGTHCKWATLQDGKLADFATAMTGEIFALLKSHSLLAGVMAQDARPGAAFEAGLAQSADDQLLTNLFGVRASVLLGALKAEDGASFVSGLLIGADVRAQLARADRQEVWLVSEAGLGDLYGCALEKLGVATRRVPSQQAFCSGMRRIWEMLQ